MRLKEIYLSVIFITILTSSSFSTNYSINAEIVAYGHTRCGMASSPVTIEDSEFGVLYTAKVNGVSVGTNTGNGADIVIIIPSSSLISGENPIKISATINGVVSSTIVYINIQSSLSDVYSLSWNTACDGYAAKVTVLYSKPGITYTAYFEDVAVGVATSTGGNFDIPIAAGILPVGAHQLLVTASTSTCGTVTIDNPGYITVVEAPEDIAIPSGNTVCLGQDGTINFSNPDTGVRYEAFINGVLVGVGAPSQGNLSITIPSEYLSLGSNIVTFQVTNNSCYVDLPNTATIITEEAFIAEQEATVSSICAGGISNVNLAGSEVGIVYEVVLNDVVLGTVIGDGNPISINLNTQNLGAGTYNVIVTGSIDGVCKKTMPDIPELIIKEGPDINISLEGSSVCHNEESSFSILNSELGVSYSAFLDGELVATGIGNSNDLTYTFAGNVLSSGNNIINVVAESELCSVQLSDLANMNVVPFIDAEIPVQGTTVCEGNMGIIVIQNTAVGLTYNAYIGGELMGSSVSTGGSLFLLVEAQSFEIGMYTVQLQAFQGNCSKMLSQEVTLEVISKPITNQTVMGDEICYGENANLSILNSENGVVYEAEINGVIISSAVGNSSAISLEVVNSYLITGTNVISLFADNGGCRVQLTNWGVIEQVQEVITSNLISTEGVCKDENGVIGIQNSNINTTYTAYASGIIVTSVQGNNQVVELEIPSALLLETSEFTLSANISFCKEDFAPSVNIEVFDSPDFQNEIVGDSIIEFESGTITVNQALTDVYYTVSSQLNPSNSYSSIGNNGTLTFTIHPYDLPFGDILFDVKAVSLDGCVADTLHLSKINVAGRPPIAHADTVKVNQGTILQNISILSNDEDTNIVPSSVQITGGSTTTGGTVSVNLDGTINYSPEPNFYGTDYITYEVCDETGLCDTALIIIFVKRIALISDLKFPEAFSPNGDNRNEVFFIKGLEGFPTNSIKIYNRWGNEIYKASPYNNDWDGKSSSGYKLGLDKVPSSTYYYIFNPGDGYEMVKGFIFVKY